MVNGKPQATQLSVFVKVCLMSFGILFSAAADAAVRFVSPDSGSAENSEITVSVIAPNSSNPLAEKINLKIDDKFYATQPYQSGKSSYSFLLNSGRFKNGSHKLTVLSISKGRIVSTMDRWVEFSNTELVLDNPKSGFVLSGFYNVTGLVRVNADKVNIKFDDNNQFVYSLPVVNDQTYATKFSIKIDTSRLSDGHHNMIIRAVTNTSRDVKTISRNFSVQNSADEPVFDATRIVIPDSGIYSGVYTVGQSTTWQARLDAINKFEQLIYQRSDLTLGMDRQFYRWDNLVKRNKLNPYIKATSDAGRIPIISLYTLNQEPVMGSLEVQCPDGSGRKVWVCIASGAFDSKLRGIAEKIRDSQIPELGFAFVHEPENEIRCHDRKQDNPEYQCVPVGKGYDMGGAADYRKAWQRLVKIFDKTGAMNVDFVWILQATTFNSSTRQPGFRDAVDYYPGNDYIDWVSADAYNTAFNGNWKSLQLITQPLVTWAKNYTPAKPLMLSEFGTAEDPSALDKAKRGKWFKAAGSWFKTQPGIKAVLYFNRSEKFGTPGNFRDWRIDTIAGTGSYPQFEFRKNALPFSTEGFSTLMQDCYFQQGRCRD